MPLNSFAVSSLPVIRGGRVGVGSGLGVVVATGRTTAFGRIAVALGERQPETEFQSGLRRFSLLILGVLLCAYLLLQEWHVPFVPLFNIFSLNEPVFQGRHWLVPTSKLAVQLGAGVICFGIAFGAFQMMLRTFALRLIFGADTNPNSNRFRRYR